jgi:hypothetical protein
MSRRGSKVQEIWWRELKLQERFHWEGQVKAEIIVRICANMGILRNFRAEELCKTNYSMIN